MELRKCKKEGCTQPVTQSTQAYCSASCAPFAHLSNGGRDRIESTERLKRYSSVEDGVRSPRLLNVGEMPDAATLKRRLEERARKNEEKRGSIMPSTTKDSTQERRFSAAPVPPISSAPNPTHGWSDEEETKKLREKHSETGTQGTERSTAQTNEEDATLETHLATSLQPSTSSSEARLTSLNLIDDSAEHLHSLMKSIGRDRPESLKDPRVVQAAANCAKQIHSLIRLKLDVLKELRK